MKYRGLTYNREKESYEWVYGLPSYGYATDEVAEIGTVYGDFKEIFPDTLGEQTPYRDKNGKEIYTGDIVALEVDGQIREFVVDKANLEVIKNEEIDQVTILSKELEKVKDVFDYCIIDCPPDINISVINALVAADEAIIPIKIDGYAFDGMKELEEQINNAKQLNPKLKFRGCLVTMFYNRDVCRQGEEYLQNQRYPVFRTHIRRTEKADEVTFTTQSLMQYSPRSGAARDYKTFVKEYLEG